jgi:hypothetical protein
MDIALQTLWRDGSNRSPSNADLIHWPAPNRWSSWNVSSSVLVELASGQLAACQTRPGWGWATKSTVEQCRKDIALRQFVAKPWMRALNFAAAAQFVDVCF